MYFNTLEFYGFFVLTLVVAVVTRRPAWVLLGASAVFYAVAGVVDSALIASVILVNWILVRFVEAPRARVAAAIAVNIGVLAAVKYRVFLAGDFGATSTTYIDTVLPLGISFYTFQLLGFQIDAARDPRHRETRPGPFALFVVFFPQLIAGPIVRARELIPQVRRLFAGTHRKRRLYCYALALCTLGLVKKIVFADSLAPLVDDIFHAGPGSAQEAWTGAWLFTFQIYFDFSGYSDIAIGCAYLLGIRLPVNFRTPYMSRSPREFWQRWHITLSTWIRDYLYIPLGGGRGPAARQLAVLVGVMGIAGLWHGANLTFVIWGLAWGLYIGAHRFAAARVSQPTGRAIHVLAYAGHLFVIVCLWVLFRAENLGVALAYLDVMFSAPAVPGPDAVPVLAGCAALLGLHWAEARGVAACARFRARRWNTPLVWGFLAGVCLWLVILPSYTQNPFIYFRF